MKRELDRQSGFTLVELLVVIAIIGLLMALLFPAIGKIKDMANKNKAQVVVTQLVGASKAYYNEYGRWPGAGGTILPADFVMVLNGWIDPLTGIKKDAASTVGQQNPRGIQFFEVRAKDVAKAATSGDVSPGSLLDPWGLPYAYCFDTGQNGYAPAAAGGSWHDTTAYDNLIDMPYVVGAGNNFISGGCAFFSCGPDRVSGLDPADPQKPNGPRAYEDDVKSW